MDTPTDLTQLATQLAQLAQTLAAQSKAPEPVPVRQMPQRILLTPEEAAERLGVGRTTMFKLIRCGEIESVQIGKLRRIPVSAIEDYAASLVRITTHEAA